MVSGGSLNPAVTLALCLHGVIAWWKWPFYALAEVLGAFLAACVQFGVFYGRCALPSAHRFRVVFLSVLVKGCTSPCLEIIIQFTRCRKQEARQTDKHTGPHLLIRVERQAGRQANRQDSLGD